MNYSGLLVSKCRARSSSVLSSDTFWQIIVQLMLQSSEHKYFPEIDTGLSRLITCPAENRKLQHLIRYFHLEKPTPVLFLVFCPQLSRFHFTLSYFDDGSTCSLALSGVMDKYVPLYSLTYCRLTNFWQTSIRVLTTNSSNSFSFEKVGSSSFTGFKQPLAKCLLKPFCTFWATWWHKTVPSIENDQKILYTVCIM